MDKNIFGQNVKKRLAELGMYQRELAKSVGVCEVTLGRYLNGERKPSIYTALKIADTLKCSIYDLVE